ncbi:MAG TPA: hypothetical protein VK656_04455 [Candidatus Acidoferrum sp.]|nr:hypothetical protein [Candidatus Acidoferrum sp.]
MRPHYAGVQFARIFYGCAGVVALVVAGFAVWPTVTGVPGASSGSLVVFTIGLAVVGLIFLAATFGLGREPSSWGLLVAVAVVAGIVGASGTAAAVLGVASSDPQAGSPGPVVYITAAVPVLAALVSPLFIWRAHERAVDTGTGAPAGQAEPRQ